MISTSLLAAGTLAFGLVLAAGPAAIGLLRRLKAGQAIRADGPQGHLKKAGTPTMGGVLLLLGWLTAALAFGRGERFVLLLTVAVLGFALIGLADDFIIVVHKRSLGLRAREKLLAQAILGVLVAAAVAATPDLGTSVRLPGVPVTLQLPLWGYILFGTLIMVGTSNAVNLADGLDGLAAGTVA
ncbi:MAG: phospho-N-acetylmuramoyl-pentapeptide-transferase, partial [Bacillota bacterium]|nr:phospho-N-acetylmuramoyl-pentapeptide-transferase [Bacillota bacterium]